MDDIDEAPDWMVEADHRGDHKVEHDHEHDHDENSLASILQRAVAEISELGGRERHFVASSWPT
jgi:hypothetical protein